VYSSDSYLVYSKTSGIQVTMTIPESSSTMSILQSNGRNGAQDNYVISVKNYNDLEEGDYIVLYAPNEITFTNYTTCGTRPGIRSFYKCKYSSPNKMTVAFSFSKSTRRNLGSVSANSGFDFMIQNITNPASMAPSS
jgi:hypothetical protein